MEKPATPLPTMHTLRGSAADREFRGSSKASLEEETVGGHSCGEPVQFGYSYIASEE